MCGREFTHAEILLTDNLVKSQLLFTDNLQQRDYNSNTLSDQEHLEKIDTVFWAFHSPILLSGNISGNGFKTAERLCEKHSCKFLIMCQAFGFFFRGSTLTPIFLTLFPKPGLSSPSDRKILEARFNRKVLFRVCALPGFRSRIH